MVSFTSTPNPGLSVGTIYPSFGVGSCSHKLSRSACIWSEWYSARSAQSLDTIRCSPHTSPPRWGLPAPCPIVRDLDGGIYVKEDAGKLVLGGFEPDAKPWDAGGPSGDTPFLLGSTAGPT